MSAAPGLIADIGGTHARFALVRPGEQASDALTVRCADYRTPEDGIEAYLRSVAPPDRPTRAVFAVAGAIDGEDVAMTNHPWSISSRNLRENLDLADLTLINDFVAVALSVPHLSDEYLIQVGGGAVRAGMPKGVIGPGTGLGVSALAPAGEGWIPLATEGGHVTLAPADEVENTVLASLRKKIGHVSAERFVSGPGLVNLYVAMCQLENRPALYTSADMISRRALEGSCNQCKEALEMFFAMLGTVAGNLALTLGARGGIYLAGGILPRMIEAFQASGFRRRFEDKGRFHDYVAAIPTFVITHPFPAFVGLARMVDERRAGK